ncbi:MAG: hypothetical protein LIO58_01750 [Oscillospiraceae bacterium]|nr:hypothetical protein [Oscillospiraceae bacterium]
MYYNDSYVIYTLEGAATADPERSYTELYQYHFATKESVQLANLMFPNISTGSIVIDGERLYIVALGENDRSVLYEINMTTHAANVIKQLEEHVIFPYLYQSGNQLILFSIIRRSEETDYTIETIDLTSLNSELIVKKSTDTDNAYISCIEVDGDTIYAYGGNIGGPKCITTYTLAGTEMAVYQLDISDFIGKDENNLDVDAVFWMQKTADYFCMHTINSRILILQQNVNSIDQIQTPENLYDKLPSLYGLLDNYGTDSKNVYLASDHYEPNYILNTENGTFTGFTMPTDATANDKYSCLCSYNDTLLIKRTAKDSEAVFYLLQIERYL